MLSTLGDEERPGETDFGEAQEDEVEDGRGVFLGLEAGVGAELVGGVPEAFFRARRWRCLFQTGRSKS